MLLFVGLGNPGARYAGNRHNVGVMALEAIAARHGFSPFRSKFQSRLSDGLIDGNKVLAVAPQTYMNLSGQAVGEALRFHKLEPSAVTVFHDELDLPPGKLRVKQGGGAGGHNGLKSIDQHIGKDYWRVRIGIGHPGHKDAVSPYVLSDFAKADADWLDPLLDAIARHAPLLAAGKQNDFASRIAQDTAPPKPPRKPPAASETAVPPPDVARPLSPAPLSSPATERGSKPSGPFARLKHLFDRR